MLSSFTFTTTTQTERAGEILHGEEVAKCSDFDAFSGYIFGAWQRSDPDV